MIVISSKTQTHREIIVYVNPVPLLTFKAQFTFKKME